MEEREEGTAAAPEEEWLIEGPQAPAPDPDQRTRRLVAARGAATSNPAPPTKKVKKIASKGDKLEVVHRQSTRLSEAKTPPAKRRAVTGVDPSPQSSPASSQSSILPETSAPRTSSKLPGSSTPPTMKRGRATPSPAAYTLGSMLVDPE